MDVSALFPETISRYNAISTDLYEDTILLVIITVILLFEVLFQCYKVVNRVSVPLHCVKTLAA